MTNLEALKANVSQVHGIVISENAFLKALLDEDITSSDSYSKATYEKSVDLATVRIYRQILGNANLNEGDVGYSLTNKEHIKTVIDALLIKHNLRPEFGSLPTVNSHPLW